MTVLKLEIDDKTFSQVENILSNYGLSTSQVTDLFFQHIIKNKSIPEDVLTFALKRQQAYLNNPLTMQAIEDARNNQTTPCPNFEDFIRALEEEIKNENN